MQQPLESQPQCMALKNGDTGNAKQELNSFFLPLRLWMSVYQTLKRRLGLIHLDKNKKLVLNSSRFTLHSSLFFITLQPDFYVILRLWSRELLFQGTSTKNLQRLSRSANTTKSSCSPTRTPSVCAGRSSRISSVSLCTANTPQTR